MKNLFLFGIAALFFQTPAHARTPVVLQLRWTHQFQFAGYYAAQTRGFYRDAGLQVEILEGRNGLDLTRTVTSGIHKYSIGSANLLAERAAGRPIVVLAPLFQHSPEVLMTMKSSKITKPSDLVGKRVMVRSLKLFPVPNFKGMLVAAGVNPEKVNWIDHSWDYRDLLEGNTDAMSGYLTADIARLRDRNVEVNVLNPMDYGIDFYADLLYTSEETIENDEAGARKFLKASMDGWRYAFAHEDEMIEHILGLPGVRERGITRDILKSEALSIRKLVEPDLIEIGYMSDWRWNRIADVYKRLGQLPEEFTLDRFLLPNEATERQAWARRALQSLFVLSALGVLTLIWVFQLKRQVAAKTLALQTEIERSKEQKLLAERANRIKSLFLANMSHEIRTPLTAILGFSELLRNDDLSGAERKQYLSIIERTGMTLGTILNDILDLSKVEAGRFEIVRADCSLKTILREVEALLRLKAEAKHIALRFEDDGKTPDHLHTDPIRLKQILLNVIGNAIKFTDRGSVEVSTSFDGAAIEFRVRDTGIGISDHGRSALFQPFSQVDQSVRKEFSGAGLGLTISRKLAELLGGTVALETSTPGHGSTFAIRIAYAQASALLPAPARNERPGPGLRGTRVLVVDDCYDNQLLVKLHLEREGASVTLASDGAEALHETGRGNFGIVLMDIQMPVMDGYTATMRMREQGYRHPIVALTANAMPEDLEHCLRSGCDGFLPKPVSREDLVTCVRRYAETSA